MGANSTDIPRAFSSHGMETMGVEGSGVLSKPPPKPSPARRAVTPMIAHNRIYFCKRTMVATPLSSVLPLYLTLSHPLPTSPDALACHSPTPPPKYRNHGRQEQPVQCKEEREEGGEQGKRRQGAEFEEARKTWQKGGRAEE